MRRTLHRIPYARIILIVSWTITAILALGLVFAASPQLERAMLTSDAVRDASPLSQEDAIERHSNVRDYLFGSAETIEGSSENEIEHMHDVRRLFEILAGVALLSAAIGIGALRNERSAWSRRTIKDVSLSIIGFVIGATLLSLIGGFSELFTTFHLLLFPQGNWMFAADSYLITLYPQVFFAHMAAAIGALTLIVAGVAYLLTRTPRA